MKTLILALAAVCLFLQPVHAEKGDIIPLKKTKPAKMVVPTITEEKLIAKKKKIEETEAKEGPYVASVGIYGTKRIDEAQLKQFLGKELDKWLQMGLKGDEASVDLEQKLAKKVKDHFGFYSADWSVIQFFESENQPIYIVLDVVEKEEVANRMPFLKNPTGEFKDPDGILKYWAEYENTALDMIEQGTLEPEVESCKGIAFHCPFGHKNEKLKKYQPVFVEGVKKNLNKLVQILQEDKRPEMRAAAAFVLAYHTDGQKVANWMLDRVRDPADTVRNNSLRVLGDIAELNPGIVIPIAPILQAMDFPRATDRSKSVFVGHLLALNSESVREEFRTKGTGTLLKLLDAKMPDQREFAHAILRKISGKDYAQTDFAAWRNWATKNSKDRGVSGGK